MADTIKDFPTRFKKMEKDIAAIRDAIKRIEEKMGEQFTEFSINCCQLKQTVETYGGKPKTTKDVTVQPPSDKSDTKKDKEEKPKNILQWFITRYVDSETFRDEFSSKEIKANIAEKKKEIKAKKDENEKNKYRSGVAYKTIISDKKSEMFKNLQSGHAQYKEELNK
jgi:hypothetical protein